MNAELIIILVALAISIVSGINKSRKKSHEEHSHMPEREPEDDPWATIRKYIEDARTEDYEEEEQERAPARVAVKKSASAASATQAIPDPYTSSLNEYAARKQEEGTKLRTKIAAPAETPAEQTDGVADIMEDFDLRKAVIYSEILRPRYEEM